MASKLARVAVTAATFSVCGIFAGCGPFGGNASPAAPTATAIEISTPSALQAPPASVPGYLATYSDGAIFLQWTRSGDSVTGTMTAARINLSGAPRVDTSNANFSGVVSGASVTLTFDSGDKWNGTLNGSGLTLSYPAGNGTLSTSHFSAADVSAYNSAVQSLQVTADRMRTPRDLRSGQLQPSDLPIQYSNQNMQIYPNYTEHMLLNGATTFHCNRPPSLLPATWSQGMIRAIYNDAKHFILQCGWLLRSEDDARTAFQTSQRADQRLSGSTPLASNVGNESYASTNTPPSSTTYYLVFRHTNALIGLVATSGAPADLTPDQFLQLGATVNSRLR